MRENTDQNNSEYGHSGGSVGVIGARWGLVGISGGQWGSVRNVYTPVNYHFTRYKIFQPKNTNKFTFDKMKSTTFRMKRTQLGYI